MCGRSVGILQTSAVVIWLAQVHKNFLIYIKFLFAMCLTVQIEARIFHCITLLKLLFPDILKETGIKVN